MYNTQNHSVFGLIPLSRILGNIKHDVSETGSVSVLRWKGKTSTQLGPLERASLNHWTALSDLHSYLIPWDQGNSEGDNKKIYNENYDKACTCVELG
jgi:hypothetical protein